MQERDLPEMGAAKDFTIHECSFFIQMSFCHCGHAAGTSTCLLRWTQCHLAPELKSSCAYCSASDMRSRIRKRERTVSLQPNSNNILIIKRKYKSILYRSICGFRRHF
jgi:hypothetical protein